MTAIFIGSKSAWGRWCKDYDCLHTDGGETPPGWNRDYKPWASIDNHGGLTTCMWCGASVHEDQVDEHEAECGS